MRQRGYFFRRAPNAYFARLDSMIHRADVGPVRDFIFGKSDSLFERFLAEPTAAYENPESARGPFPLVMYSEGYNNRSHDNSVLAEFLASHGYVVATVPQVGTRSTRLVLRITAPDLETQARDIEFAMGEAQNLSFVDRKKLAVMGYSMGGIVSLIIAARNPGVDAVVGLDPSFRAPRFVPLVLSSAWFNPRAMRAPILSLQSGHPSEAGAQDSTVVDSLRFADRYVGRVGHAMHGDFSDFAMLAPLFPVDVQGRTAVEARDAHEAIAMYVLQFLDGTLRNDRTALAFVSHDSESNNLHHGTVRIRLWPGIQTPSEEEFVSITRSRGLNAALDSLSKTRARYPMVDPIDQPTLNRLGYGLVEAGSFALAVDVFKLNTAAHPNSSDSFDSLAEGFIAAGRIHEAIAAYRQVLAVLPRDPSLDEAAKATVRVTTERKIADLEKKHP
jgi:pimeloyl-ACP methyl ester carboxylesterase